MLQKTTLELLVSRLPAVVDLKTAAIETRFAEQTLRNRLHKGTCPIPAFKDGSRWKFRVPDLAAYIDGKFGQAQEAPAKNPKRGRPTKADEIERRRAISCSTDKNGGA